MNHFARQQKLHVTNKSHDAGGIRFCLKCGCIKPDRSHHCIICGKCILRFDHHCPMVDNCINHNNYKSFVLFLGYCFSLCVFGILVLLPYFRKADRFGHVFFLFYSSVVFGSTSGGMLLLHLALTAMNQTTVESIRPTMFSYGPDKYGYYLDVKRNFLQIFGSNALLWFIPVFSSDGDGTVWTQRTREGEEDNSADAVDVPCVQIVE